MQWKEIASIIEALEEQYPDMDLEDISLDDLYELILDLPDFSDDPENVNDVLLKKILEQWSEYRADGL